jgi:hypothetical protein
MLNRDQEGIYEYDSYLSSQHDKGKDQRISSGDWISISVCYIIHNYC